MKVLVYTAAIGTSERPKPIRQRFQGVQYVCVTDAQTFNVTGWVPAGYHGSATSGLGMARHVKTSPEKYMDADVSVWMDASFDLLDLEGLLSYARMMGDPIVAFAHPDRHRISTEADEVIRVGQADAEAVERQVAHYRSKGFDTDANPQIHLTTTGLLVRQHTSAVARFNRLWWQHMQEYTLRDQLSVDFCAHVRRQTIGYLPGDYRQNDFVRYDRTGHNKATRDLARR